MGSAPSSAAGLADSGADAPELDGAAQASASAHVVASSSPRKPGMATPPTTVVFVRPMTPPVRRAAELATDDMPDGAGAGTQPQPTRVVVPASAPPPAAPSTPPAPVPASASASAPSSSRPGSVRQQGPGPDAARLGISLGGLKKLQKRIEDDLGAASFHDDKLSTWDLVEKWVKQHTIVDGVGRRLVQVEALVDPEHVGAPAYYVNHAWGNPAHRLFDYILASLQAADDSCRVWLDIVCVNQHDESPERKVDIATDTLRAVHAACHAGTIAVMDLSGTNPATRALVLYDWLLTILLHGPDALHLQLQPEDRATVVASIDVGNAQSRKAEDKEMVLDALRKLHMEPGQFDSLLKLQLLLEPLSYRVEVSRLRERAKAANTQWTFEDLSAWLHSKDGSWPGASDKHVRVVCVAAGRGEGKSTISAELCPSDDAEASEAGRSQIAAYHFLSASDQRRLEPVRIIKSLAFQLARRYDVVRERLLSLDVGRVAQLTDAKEAFDMLLREPLDELYSARPGERVVLLIDALDEADPVQSTGGERASCPRVCGNRALQLATEHFCRLPPSVAFIFTTRPEAAAKQALPCLHRTFPGSVLVLQPTQLRRTSKGQGLMVYSTVAAALKQLEDRLLKEGRISAGDVYDSCPLVPGLKHVYEVYRAVFDLTFKVLYKDLPEKDKQDVRDLLAVLVTAREPLPQSFLQKLQLGDRVISLLPGLGVLHYVESHTVYHAHASLEDWLLDPKLSGEYAINLARGHERIGLQLAETWHSWLEYSADAQLHGSTLESYLMRNLVRHLASASSKVALDALDALLTKPQFIADVVTARTATAVISALSAMPQPTKYSYDVLRWLRAEMYNLKDAWRRARAAEKKEARGGSEAPRERTSLVSEVECSLHFCSPPKSKLYELASSTYQRTLWRLDKVLPMGVFEEWPPCEAVLKGHDEHVTCLSFAPDGYQLASASYDSSIRVWDTATGQCTAKLYGHVEWVISVAFGPDGRHLCSGGLDGTVKVWDAATGQCLVTFTEHGEHVTCTAWDADGTAIASGGWDNRVLVWGAPGKTDDGVADWSCGKCIDVLEGHTAAVYSVAWRPGGRQLASASWDKTVRLWEPSAEGRFACVRTLEGHTHEVKSLAWSPSGAMLASAGYDKVVRIWDLESGTCAKSLEGHLDYVASIAFSDDGKMLASGSGDTTVRIWNTKTAECVGLLEGHVHVVHSVLFKPSTRVADGGAADTTSHIIVSGSFDATVRMWACSDRAQQSAVVQGHRGAVSCVAFSPDGRNIISGSFDKTVRVWDAATGQLLATLKGHAAEVNCVAFAPDGGKFATCGYDKKVLLWPSDHTLQMTAKLTTLQGHRDEVNCVAFSSDGELMASGSNDKTARIWYVAESDCIKALFHDDWVTCLTFTSDTDVLGLGFNDGTVLLQRWQGASRQAKNIVANLTGHTARVNALVHGHGGGCLISCSDDKTIRVWAADPATDADAEPRWACTDVLREHSEGINALSVGDDGVLASASDDRTVRLWKQVEGEAFKFTCIATLPGHTGKVFGVALGRGGRLASASDDRTVRLTLHRVIPSPQDTRRRRPSTAVR